MGTAAHTRPLRTESTMAEGPNTWVARLQCGQRGEEQQRVGWVVTIPCKAWKAIITGFDSYSEVFSVSPSLTRLLLGVTASGQAYRVHG